MPKEKILQLTESRAVTIKKGAIIPKGKFEILPELADIPGAAFGTVWDSLLGSYNHALVTVVAPQKFNGVQDGQVKIIDIATNFDQRYVDIQLGYMQAYVEGGLGASATKKPRVLIMFVSKFDLYSKLPPYDSAAEKIKEKVLDIFADHINSARSAAKKAGVPFELIVGSSVEKWNTGQVLEAVTTVLYAT